MKARAQDDRRQAWACITVTAKMLSFLKHNAFVTLGTSRLPNCMVVNYGMYQLATFRTKGVSPYVHARAVYFMMYIPCGAGGGGGGGEDCIRP